MNAARGPANRSTAAGSDRQAELEPATSRMASWRSATDELLPDRWSWRESNPRPQNTNRGCYDHSRVCGSRLPPRRVERITNTGILPPALSPVSAVFAGCQRVSPRRPPLLLVPGCSGLAPRAIAGRGDSRPS